MKNHLFIYGTLLPEYASSEIASAVHNLNFIGTAYVYGKLYDFGDYPGAVLDPSSQRKVLGRLFEIPEGLSVLNALDSYEGFKPDDADNSLFVRKQTTATLDGGKKIRCWIYLYNQDPGAAPLVADGDYEKYQAA